MPCIYFIRRLKLLSSDLLCYLQCILIIDLLVNIKIPRFKSIWVPNNTSCSGAKICISEFFIRWTKVHTVFVPIRKDARTIYSMISLKWSIIFSVLNRDLRSVRDPEYSVPVEQIRDRTPKSRIIGIIGVINELRSFIIIQWRIDVIKYNIIMII